MKRILLFLLILSFLLPSCSAENTVKSAGEIAKSVKENTDLLLNCYQILSEMKKERIYVAMVEKEDEEGNKIEGSARLVSYEKEGDDPTEIENETLKEVLCRFDLALIFFQTASDGRECVIFSYTKENEQKKVQNGFYYSPDALPCGWWGRKENLIRKDDRYLQMNQKEDAVYYTVSMTEHFFYYEKYGDLLA